MISRRRVLQVGAGLALAGWSGAGRSGPMKMKAAPRVRPLNALNLPKFVDALPIPSVAKSSVLTMREIEVQVHRDLKPTRCWSYGDTVPGPVIEAQSGKPLSITWKNELPVKHFLPVDHTLCGAGTEVPEVKTIAHVHGARVPPQSDGYPDQWFTRGKSLTSVYPNKQEAATLWYHDHAMGIERLNQYAGLFGAYYIRDSFEASLKLPEEIPLFIFDRMFDQDGQLQYPTSGMPESPWISEMYGDAILVNGKLAPDFQAERKAYRFRICNASNARFLYLSGLPFVQIGSDQGFLPAPVSLSTLTLAPAERADVVVDFSQFGGRELILKSQAFDLLRVRVGNGPAAPAWKPPQLREIKRLSKAVKTRRLGIDEYVDPKTQAMLMLLDGKRWHEPVSEKPLLGTTEIWELVNYTGDTHPIHLHLVRFQLLDRQKFDVDAWRFEKKFQTTGAPFPPEANELGWKDTIQCYPESITRIIVKFEGYAGRYVWHCHVLEHAANEMMRPFEVIRPAS